MSSFFFVVEPIESYSISGTVVSPNKILLKCSSQKDVCLKGHANPFSKRPATLLQGVGGGGSPVRETGHHWHGTEEV